MEKIDPNRIMTINELSLVLNISEWTIKKLEKSEQIPSSRKGNQIVFNFQDVLQHFRKMEGGAA